MWKHRSRRVLSAVRTSSTRSSRPVRDFSAHGRWFIPLFIQFRLQRCRLYSPHRNEYLSKRLRRPVPGQEIISLTTTKALKRTRRAGTGKRNNGKANRILKVFCIFLPLYPHYLAMIYVRPVISRRVKRSFLPQRKPRVEPFLSIVKNYVQNHNEHTYFSFCSFLLLIKKCNFRIKLKEAQ